MPPKDRANIELKKSGIEIDESEIDNGIITVTCHKSSALAAAQQAIKELEEMRTSGKDDTDGIAGSAKAKKSTWYDTPPPADKCVGHDHQHHAKKGGKPNKKDLNKPNMDGASRDSIQLNFNRMFKRIFNRAQDTL